MLAKQDLASKLLGLLQLFLHTLKRRFLLPILDGDLLNGCAMLFVFRVIVVENQFSHVKPTNSL